MASSLTVDDLRPRLREVTVVDVRSPGEYAAGHIPGAHNVPLNQIRRALPALRAAADRGTLAVVCASGARSRSACEELAAAGVRATALTGGTTAWAERGHPLERLEGARAVWPIERQVRLVAGSLVLLGLAADRALPGARWLSAAIGGGLVFSGVTGFCGMAKLLARLPYNNRSCPAGSGLEDTLARLHG